MARHGAIAIHLAVLLALLEFGSCLKCYQCNTEQDKACGDPFKSTKPAVDCTTQDSVTYNNVNLGQGLLPQGLLTSVTGAPRYCHKIVMNTGTIVRTCLDVNPNDINKTCQALQSSTDPTKKIKQCSVCDKDNCNGASSITFSLPIATLALIVSFLFCKQ